MTTLSPANLAAAGINAPRSSPSDDVREQAGWGHLLSDPEWGSPLPSRGTPSKIPFIDITDAHERSVA